LQSEDVGFFPGHKVGETGAKRSAQSIHIPRNQFHANQSDGWVMAGVQLGMIGDRGER
jgi:hypothetical protein